MATVTATPAVKCQDGAIYRGPQAEMAANACAIRVKKKDPTSLYEVRAVNTVYTLEVDGVAGLQTPCGKTEFDNIDDARACVQYIQSHSNFFVVIYPHSDWKVEKYQVGAFLPSNDFARQLIIDRFIKKDGRPYKAENNILVSFDECFPGAAIKDRESASLCAKELSQIKGQDFGLLTLGANTMVANESQEEWAKRTFQVVPCEVGAVMDYNSAMSCQKSVDFHTQRTHFLADVSVNPHVPPKWTLLPLDVGRCISGGALLTYEEAVGCYTHINYHAQDGSSRLFFVNWPRMVFGVFPTIEISMSDFLCRSTGFCGPFSK